MELSEQKPFELGDAILQDYPQLSSVTNERERVLLSAVYMNNRTVIRWLDQIQKIGRLNLRREAIPYHLKIIRRWIGELGADRNYPHRDVIRNEENHLTASKERWDRCSPHAQFDDDPQFTIERDFRRTN